jgi:pilus assembly protein CpaF
MISRLESMVLMGTDIPISAIRSQIAAGIDIFIHLGRLRDHSRKVLEIAEVDGITDGKVCLRTLYSFKPGEEDIGSWELISRIKHTGKLEMAGIYPGETGAY